MREHNHRTPVLSRSRSGEEEGVEVWPSVGSDDSGDAAGSQIEVLQVTGRRRAPKGRLRPQEHGTGGR